MDRENKETEPATTTDLSLPASKQLKTVDSSKAMARIDGCSLAVKLIEAELVSPMETERIIQYQSRHGLDFVDAAIKCKVLKKSDRANARAIALGYPCLLPSRTLLSKDLVMGFKPFSNQAEAFRGLRSKLLIQWKQSLHRSLAIISAGPAEGRSYVCANLAISFAQFGKSVLLIDADLRHSNQHEIFNLPNHGGLTATLSGQASKLQFYRIPLIPQLYVAPAGPNLPNPQELISQPGFKELLARAKKRFEIVILDTPAANSCADTDLIATTVDQSLVITRQHSTTIRAAKKLTERLSNQDTNLAGCILNRF